MARSLFCSLVESVGTALSLQFVFDQERHHLGQAHRLLFGVSETSDIFTFHQRLTVRSLNVAKRAGCVADQGNWLSCGQE